MTGFTEEEPMTKFEQIPGLKAIELAGAVLKVMHEIVEFRVPYYNQTNEQFTFFRSRLREAIQDTLDEWE